MTSAKEWWDGAKGHNGWLTATALCAMCWAFDARPGGWLGLSVGLLWFIPVVLTCRSVSRANQGSSERSKP